MPSAEPLWPQALTHYPFAAALLPGWREHAADLPADYQAALDDVLIAFDPGRPLDERYQRLLASRAHLIQLTAAPDSAHDGEPKPEHASSADAPIAPQLLRIRLHLALGEHELARQWTDRLLRRLDVDAATAEVETLLRAWPCLPISAGFETCAPAQTEDDGAKTDAALEHRHANCEHTNGEHANGEHANREHARIDVNAWRDWLSAQLLDTQALLTRAQRHTEPKAALPLLVKRRQLPYAGIESERRLALTALRLGKKVTIKPESRLVTDGQNPHIWTQLGETANSEQPRPGTNQPAAPPQTTPAHQAVPAKPTQRNAKPAKTQPTPPAASKPPVASKHSPARKQRPLARPWQLEEPIRVVDIGANPIDGSPPYASLLKQGVIRLVGFEPQADALAKLQQMKGPHETYLPHAVGDGGQATLYICQASGMTSTLKPNNAVLDHFQGYPIWGKVKSTAVMDTVRLDDVAEIAHIDWLKIDIQGGELTVFKHGERKLKDTLVIQTEANFIQLYEGQPLFADIDQWMRAHGFMLHTLLEQRRRLYAPMKLKGGIHQGINQLTTADAVYIRDINQLDTLSTDQLKKLAVILHVAYGSYDLSLLLLRRLEEGFDESAYLKRIGKPLPLSLSARRPVSDAADVKHASFQKETDLDAVEMIFVVGCGHTGTTLMATILGESDAIHTIKRETEWFLREQDFTAELRQEREQAIAAGKRCLLEKTPRHVHRFAEITDAFPNAKFVIMTREPKDVVASIKNRSGNFDAALQRWLRDNQQALHIAEHPNALLIRYEDLVTQPSETLKQICGFLGVEYSDAMLEYHRSEPRWFGVKPKQTDGKGEQGHLQNRAWQMTQPIHDRRGIWREYLTEQEAQQVDKETAVMAEQLGYKSTL